MKKFTKKSWEKKNSQKGFTLVELVVVLVILAILTAIMVPALTGWIEKAKEKQVSLDARSVYLAAQTLASEEYAKAPTPTTRSFTREDMLTLATVTDDSQAIVVYYGSNTGGSKEFFTVIGLKYTSGSVVFDIGNVTGSNSVTY